MDYSGKIFMRYQPAELYVLEFDDDACTAFGLSARDIECDLNNNSNFDDLSCDMVDDGYVISTANLRRFISLLQYFVDSYGSEKARLFFNMCKVDGKYTRKIMYNRKRQFDAEMVESKVNLKNRKLYESMMRNISGSIKKMLNESMDEYDIDEQLQIALGDYLELTDEESLEYIEKEGDYLFSFNEKEWYVFPDEDTAKEYTIKLLSDKFECGNIMDYVNFDYIPGGIQAYVDTEWFDDLLREDYQQYIDDIRDEAADNNNDNNDDSHPIYKTRLEEEMAEAGCDDEEDFLDYLCDNAGDSVDYFKLNFGDNEFDKCIKNNNLINIDDLVEYLIESDGIANELASYDGDEIELENGFLAYRVN